MKLAPHMEQFRRFLAAHYLNLARIFLQADKHDKLVGVLQQAIPLLEELIREKPDPTAQRRDLVMALNTLGTVLAQNKRHDEAFAAHHRAVEVVEDMVTAGPGNAENIDSLSSACSQLAQDFVRAGRGAEAAALRERQADFWSRLRRVRTADRRAALEHVAALFARAQLAYAQSDTAVALAWFRKLRSELDTLASVHAANPDVQRHQFLCLKGIGDMHYLRRETAEAVAAWEAAVAVGRDKLLPQDPQRSAWNANIGGLLHNLGHCHAAAGRLDKAVEYCHEAIKYQKIAYKQNPESSRPWFDNHYVMLANLLRELKRPADAAEATRARVKLWPTDPVKHIDAAGEIALCIPLANADAKQAKLATTLADEAVALIAQAIAQGYADGQRLQSDKALAPLRERADFRKLVSELSAKKGAATQK